MAVTPTHPAEPPPSQERAEQILAEIDRLPTLPAVAARLITATASPDSSARQIAEIIELDASLTAAILRLARRADLGIRSNVTTVARAVPLLGFSAVRNAALSVRLHELLATPDESDTILAKRREMWRHNLAVACVAEMFAERLGDGALTGDAFVCGLLHDIGKIALDACFPKSYRRVVDRVERRHECICDAERDILGLDHTIAGKRLVTRWGLPQPIVDCVWLHHQPPDSLPASVRHNRRIPLVHLADNLVRREGIGFSGYQHVTGVAGLLASLDLGEADADAIMQALPSRLEPLADLVGLDDTETTAERVTHLARANRELGRINEELLRSNRRLTQASACVAFLEKFTDDLRAESSVADVCGLAAEVLKAATGAGRVLVAWGPTGGRGIYAGVSGDDQVRPKVMFVDVNDCAERPLDFPGDNDPSETPAPATVDHLWDRCVGRRSGDRIRVVRLGSENGRVAIAMIEGPDPVVREWQHANDTARVLTSAIGLALASAATRLECDRMTEDLLDANRRLRLAQIDLVRGQSLSMIAAMAAGAAHELNNPLSVISGRAQMELGRATDPGSVRALEIILEQTQRATRIVSDLMQFAKPEPPRAVLQSVRDVLERLSQHWRGRTPTQHGQWSISLADPAATVYADDGQLRAILDAVINNAVEATDPATARIQINSASRASDVRVRIVVEDNGAGMSREVLEHACDPFFSSRPAGRGRGLGLSHAHRFAEINGGRLTLESTPGTGTRVTVELPARPPAA